MGRRLFDILFSVSVLLLLLPLLAVIAIWIRWDSPGPVLFRQMRVGRGGREFAILKFRTMRVAATAGLQITAEGDPRITVAGRSLRRYKLDELPQFINILCGNMSVVGPRPEVPGYVALYPPADREVVLGVRPGITDPASLAYAHEGRVLDGSCDPERVYVEQILPAKLAMSVRYVHERDFRGDLAIIARTAWSCVIEVMTAHHGGRRQ